MAGCASLPPMESPRLIERMTNAYASCQSFDDTGSIRELRTELGDTIISEVSFRIQFSRGRAYRLELHSERKGGAGPYSLIYYWDGQTWSTYDSLDLHDALEPVHTNQTDSAVLGSGTALSYELVPGNLRLLHMKEGLFSGFRLYDSAEVAVGRFHGRSVYRLTLHIAFGERDHDTHDYWIDPHTYMILRERAYSVTYSEDRVDTTRRDTFHSPEPDALPEDRMIEFEPPAWSLPVISYSGSDGSSSQEAVIIKGVANEDAAIIAEIAWLRRKYPGFEWQGLTPMSHQGKHYDLMHCTTSAGENKTIYFDVSECFSK